MSFESLKGLASLWKSSEIEVAMMWHEWEARDYYSELCIFGFNQADNAELKS